MCVGLLLLAVHVLSEAVNRIRSTTLTSSCTLPCLLSSSQTHVSIRTRNRSIFWLLQYDLLDCLDNNPTWAYYSNFLESYSELVPVCGKTLQRTVSARLLAHKFSQQSSTWVRILQLYDLMQLHFWDLYLLNRIDEVSPGKRHLDCKEGFTCQNKEWGAPWWLSFPYTKLVNSVWVSNRTESICYSTSNKNIQFQVRKCTLIFFNPELKVWDTVSPLFKHKKISSF